MIFAPLSWYSSLETQKLVKVESVVRIDPPIQAEIFRSGGQRIWGATGKQAMCVSFKGKFVTFILRT